MNVTSPMRAAAREMKRKARLNSDSPCCLFCGFSHWESLIPVKLQWLVEERGVPIELLERHHVVGAAHDLNFTVPLCRNCHGVVTEDLRRAGVSMRPAADSRTRTMNRLHALAAFFELCAPSLRDWADDLPNDGGGHE